MGVSFAIELHNSFMDVAVEIIRTIERLMSEVMTLQIAPENLDVVELRRVFRQPLNPEPVGAFGEGSMAPKVRAAIDFARRTGGRAVITVLDRGQAAVRGEAGTTITAETA